MSRRTLWTVVFLWVTGAAISMEIWAATDHNPDTPPWTELVTTWWPAPVTFAAIGLLTTWLGPHFAAAYRNRKEAPMNIKFEPVRWMTWTLAVLAALTGADAQFHLLPAGWTKWLLYVGAVLTVMLGAATRSSVTPLTAPKDSAGVALVPVTMKPETPPPDLPGVPTSAWAPRHIDEA
jgi:hypothetical protein